MITHADLAASPTRAESRLSLGLVARNEVSIVEWERLRAPTVTGAAELAGVRLEAFDVCLVFVRFKLLSVAPDFDWAGFGGKRVWLEEDAWLSYSPAHREFHGRFVPLYERHRFDLMISSGRYVSERLRREGVNAKWVPKGYSRDVFGDLERPRSGVCTFGTRWPSRRALYHHLKRRGVGVADVSGPFDSLNERLNRHAGALVCNMTARPPLGVVGRAVARRRPGFVRVYPAVEPMAKLFEVAAAGCAPVVDEIDELRDLGFVDGVNCLTYQSFDDAVRVIAAASDSQLIELGRAASSLVQERHTWDHRADEVTAILAKP